MPDRDGWNLVALSTACTRDCVGLERTVEEFDSPRRPAGDILVGREGGSGGAGHDRWGGGGCDGAVGRVVGGGGGGVGGTGGGGGQGGPASEDMMDARLQTVIK